MVCEEMELPYGEPSLLLGMAGRRLFARPKPLACWVGFQVLPGKPGGGWLH